MYKRQEAYCPAMIKQLATQFGKFDILIDDGFHEAENQQFFLDSYAALCASGGKLIIEECKDEIRLEHRERADCDVLFTDTRYDSWLLIYHKGGKHESKEA